jgi:acetyl-CoA carboxylase/biotin carboxylase 1
VEVTGGSNNNNYNNVELIVDIATRYKVDCVFPGWGHASENPKVGPHSPPSRPAPSLY